MAVVVDVLVALLLVSGGAFVFVGGLGALRMPDLYTRVHAAGLTDSMGTMLILLGSALDAGLSLTTLKLLTVLFFLLVTSPTATYALANAALLAEAHEKAERRAAVEITQ